MRWRLLLLMLGLGIIFGAAMPRAWATVIYDNPKWKGRALDWCKTLDSSCGQPAADLFCQKQGLPRAENFQFEGAVSYSTMTVGASELCNPASRKCNSFAFIECEGSLRGRVPPEDPPPRESNSVTFRNPVSYGYRVDWCLQYRQYCGGPAAQAFCRQMGFSRVVTYMRQRALRTPTLILGARTLCQPRLGICDGFASIQCGN